LEWSSNPHLTKLADNQPKPWAVDRVVGSHHIAHHKGENEMPIETLDVYGEPTVTFKPSETVYVQTIKVGNSIRLEARLWYVNTTSGQQGWTKTTISFSDPHEALKFAAIFEAAATEFANMEQPEPAVPATSSQAPQPTKKVALNAGALKNRPPRKLAGAGKKSV
jgi:hypothetical protein